MTAVDLATKKAVAIFQVGSWPTPVGTFIANVPTTCAVLPSISSFTPTFTCSGKSATISITGSNFIGVTSVTIGGNAVDSFKVNSATNITAYVGAGKTGSVAITNSIGTVTSSTGFTDNGGFTAYAYIPDAFNNNVLVINLTTKLVKTTVPVGSFPTDVALTPDGTKAYVTNNSNQVSVINTSTNTVISTETVGYAPTGLSISPDGTKAYVVNANNNSVSVINTATNTVATTVAVGSYPLDISINPDGTKAYVTNHSANSVSVINTVNNKIAATVKLGVGTGPYGITFTPDGTKAYVTNQDSNSVSVINTATNVVTATVAVGKGPTGISICPDGTKAYVTNNGSNTVSVINIATNIVSATITVSLSPQCVSVSPDGTKAYITAFPIWVINTATDMVMYTISVGRNPTNLGNFIANIPTSCWPLPVEIANIIATNKNGAVEVQWHTATELNTSLFIIQHSTDGSSFTDIGSVKAIGSGANKYLFMDNTPANGTNYYRLKSVDIVGTISYSKVVSVQLSVNSNQLSVFPNPTKDKVTILSSHIASVQVIDNLGRVLKTQGLRDATNPTMSVSSLPTGVYHLRVQTTDGKINSVSFMKQ